MSHIIQNGSLFLYVTISLIMLSEALELSFLYAMVLIALVHILKLASKESGLVQMNTVMVFSFLLNVSPSKRVICFILNNSHLSMVPCISRVLITPIFIKSSGIKLLASRT